MTDAGDDNEQVSAIEGPETMEDFRASATAFSQLAGVLGGFSLTILVLVLTLVNENKAARDWTVGLLLIAATAYIYAAGILANSMNVGALAKGRIDRRAIRSSQQDAFNAGIIIFHTGNTFLPIGITITIYQESLWVGLAASIVIVLIAARVVTINFRSIGRYFVGRVQAVSAYQAEGSHNRSSKLDVPAAYQNGAETIDITRHPDDEEN
jgi:hypothetical protein